MDKNNIVFFDGVCNVCDKTVDFVLKYDKEQRFSFASLQSEFAQNFFLEHLFIKPKSHIQKESKSPFLFDQEVKSLKIIAQESWFSTVEQRSKEHTLKVLEF